MRIFFLVILIGFILPRMSFGQISQGGEPQDLITLKSAVSPVIMMRLWLVVMRILHG